MPVLFRTSHPAPDQRLNAVRMAVHDPLAEREHIGQQAAVPDQVRHPHLAGAGLAGAEYLARATQLQIFPRDFDCPS